MKGFLKMTALTALTAAAVSCGNNAGSQHDKDFKYLIDEFADLKIMRYQIPGWDDLTLQQKEYVYHLGEAAKYGRDILWDQHCKGTSTARPICQYATPSRTYSRTIRATGIPRTSRISRSTPSAYSSATESITTMPRTSSSPTARGSISPP